MSDLAETCDVLRARAEKAERERDEARRLNGAHAESALEYMRIADEARAERDDLRKHLLQARADSQIDGRAMRTLLGLPEDASAQDIVDALMGVVSEARLWRASIDAREDDGSPDVEIKFNGGEPVVNVRGGYRHPAVALELAGAIIKAAHRITFRKVTASLPEPSDAPEAVVHVLHNGVTLCGLGAPYELPPGHRWVRVEDIEHATCEGCKAAR